MTANRRATGIGGLDAILDGGFLEGQTALLRGPPGSGKTIVGLHFLAAGAADGETALFVNLGEPEAYVRQAAEHFDLAPDEIRFHDLSPTQEQFSAGEHYTLFEAAEVDQPSVVADLRETIEAVDPDRVLLDPITEFRYLTADDHQFRTQILGFLQFLRERAATVVLTSQAASTIPDDDLQFLVDAVLTLDSPGDSRSVVVSKFRGSSFRRGPHGYEITGAGIEVWPRLQAGADPVDVETRTMASGVPELDQLLGGGLAHGTVTFLSGPTGVGKTTTGLQFLKEAAARGDRSVLYQFEESRHTLLRRAESVNIPVEGMLEDGDLSIVEIQPEAYTVDQFGQLVRSAVLEEDVTVVMIDGVQGFTQNLRAIEEDGSTDLVRIGRYLRSKGASTIITNEVPNITGEFRVTDEGTSNLADTILFIRHVEYRGEMRKVIGALKMRTGAFERTLRELEITEYGIKVGEPLSHLRGVLTGTPEWQESVETDTT